MGGRERRRSDNERTRDEEEMEEYLEETPGDDEALADGE
jgi:hypothetical protein